MTSLPRRRLLAGAIDLGLMLGWALLIGVLAVVLYTSGAMPLLGPLLLNLIGLVLVVLPATITLTAREAGRYEATPGKLKFDLRVRRDPSGDRIGWGRSLTRNLLKLGLPWALGHLAVAATLSGGGLDAIVGVLICLAVGVAYLVSLLTSDGRTIYDHLAGTMVISTAPGRRFALAEEADDPRPAAGSSPDEAPGSVET